MIKVLIADDDNMIRETLSSYCRHEGFNVTEAADGQKAVELCSLQTFDVIVMDIMMPKLDGFSACREIRREHNTPIIMLTAYGMEYDKLHGFEVGASDYVVKPFSSKELINLLC